MSPRVTLPILAVLAMGGAGGGAWLGSSAIAEIDPAYFRDGEVSFHADRVPYRPPAGSEMQPGQLTDAATIEGLGDGCLRCGAEPVQLLSAPAPTVYDDGWGRTSYAAAEAAPAVLAEEKPDPELERVARYASYPITVEEAEAMAAAAAEAPRPAELAENEEADLPGL
jgi:hypothetical protein